jgi:hypothetical protein
VTTPSGRLPVYLASWPTSVGERVWLWRPPGIAAEDLEDETERLRAACIAREIRVNRDVRFSALVARAAGGVRCLYRARTDCAAVTCWFALRRDQG